MPADFKPMLKPLADDDRSPRKPASAVPAAGRPETFPVPGFWGRLGALLVDGAALSIPLYLLVGNAYATLYPHRWAAQALAFAAVFAYFWIGSSALTRGQTAGMWIFGYRVVGEDGAPLSAGRAALRAACVCLALVALAFTRNRPVVPHLTPAAVCGLIATQALATAYAFSAAVFCGLHPKRRAPHDLWVRSVVVRSAQAARSLDFVRDWNPSDSQRVRVALYPAIMAVALALFFFAAPAYQGRAEWARAFAVLRLIRERVPEDQGFSVVMFDLPSEPTRAGYAKRLEQRQARQAELDAIREPDEAAARKNARAYAEQTRQFEQYEQNGERFIVVFDCNAPWTTETLVASPGYRAVVDSLPSMASEVMRSPEVLPRTADGRPTSWTLSSVQAIFYEVLPMGLYVETRQRWRVEIPIATEPPAETERPRQAAPSTEDSAADSPDESGQNTEGAV